MSSTQKWICIFYIDAIAFVISLMFANVWLITLVFITWLNMCIYALSDIENRVTLFAFLISFFTFLIGRQLLERYKLHTIEHAFSNELNVLAETLILISLVTIFISYFISDHVYIKIKHSYGRTANRIDDVYYLRKASRLVCYLTYIFTLYSLLDVVRFVFSHGYLAFYTSYTSHVPYVIGKIGDIFPIAFWVYLATMPSKREAKPPIVLYVIYLTISLGTGSRYRFVAGLLTLFVYFITRNGLKSDNEIWFSRRMTITAIIIAPVLLVLLVEINLVRFGSSFTHSDILDSLTSFFYSQGVSINTIKRAQLYADRLPKGKIYLLGNVIDFLQGNIISRFLGIPHYSGNTVEHALKGHSLEHALSYVSMGSYYLKGHGLGGCYIADAFHDLRYFGVILVNVIYGCVLDRMFNFTGPGVWKKALSLLPLYYLLLAPRSGADGFITAIVDLTTWGTFLLIALVAKTMEKGHRYELK